MVFNTGTGGLPKPRQMVAPMGLFAARRRSRLRTKVNGSTTLNQNRTHNVANEITDITESTGTAWPTPTHNANGNLTVAPRPLSLGNSFDLKYDAWNRLIEVKLTGSSVVATYRYDGANRRVSQDDGTNVRHHYYSDQWQVLEERLNSATTADKRFVWGLRYIDDLILRDHGGTRHYVLHDYFNVTAIVNTSGTVQERYGYDAFGAVRYLNASFGSASSGYTWETLYGAYRYDANTGLYQVRHRYLHPKLGRWTKRDPIDYKDGSNLYAYNGSNSVNWVDINGLHAGGPIEVIVGIGEFLKGLAKTAFGIGLCRCAGCLAALNIQVYACDWYLDDEDWVRCTCDLLKESGGTKLLCRTCTFGASNAVDLAREYIGCDDI
jgi:RHS repeat-associated protein